MLAIKLQRIGKKHRPSYRLVVAERRSKMDAPPVEDLGSYDPFTKKAGFKNERVTYWLGVGAQPTITAHNLIIAQGIAQMPKRVVKMPKAEVKTSEATETTETKEAPTATAIVENPKEEGVATMEITQDAEAGELPSAPAEETSAPDILKTTITVEEKKEETE